MPAQIVQDGLETGHPHTGEKMSQTISHEMLMFNLSDVHANKKDLSTSGISLESLNSAKVQE
jgi:hypothetical protein